MIVLMMGVTGSGKSTVGKALASELSWEFADGDDFHSAENKAKMHDGHGLTDADREPWLEALTGRVEAWLREGADAVLACSALRAVYRRRLRVTSDVRLVFLRGDYELLEARIRARKGHFAGTGLLRSQFETLEPPTPDEAPIVVDVERGTEELVEEIRRRLGV